MAIRAARKGGWRRHRWRMAAWALLPLILLVPLVAMQFTDRVQWTAFDFAIAAILLSGSGAMFEVALRISRDAAYRLAVAIALATSFLLVWVSLAAGIIGAADNAANLLHAGVLAIGLAGARVARFLPHGMARALAAMAAAQALIAVVALVVDGWRAAILTLLFATLWLLAAGLFEKAARDRASGSAKPGPPLSPRGRKA